MPLSLQLEQFIHKASGQGILKALNAKVDGDLEKLASLADDCNLDSLERTHLRAFLTQVQQCSHSKLTYTYVKSRLCIVIYLAAAFNHKPP